MSLTPEDLSQMLANNPALRIQSQNRPSEPLTHRSSQKPGTGQEGGKAAESAPSQPLAKPRKERADKGKPKGVVICADCGREAVRTGYVQKYCADCSEKRDLKRKQDWSQKHPQAYDPAIEKVKRKITRGVRQDESRAINETQRRGMFWLDDCPRDEQFHFTARVRVPFDYGMSKNAIWRNNGLGHVYLRKHSKQIRESLALLFSTYRDKIVEAKLWIDVLVQKPNHKGDAINVIDLVCDALKDGLGLDDRWYSIRRLDWQIVKVNPDIIIGISQSDVEDQRVCSYCGLILPLRTFSKHKGNPKGRSRTCPTCSRLVEAVRSRERVEVTLY